MLGLAELDGGRQRALVFQRRAAALADLFVLGAGRKLVRGLVVVYRIVPVEDLFLGVLMRDETVERVLRAHPGVDRAYAEVRGVGRVEQCLDEVPVDEDGRAANVVAQEIRDIVVGVDVLPALGEG